MQRAMRLQVIKKLKVDSKDLKSIFRKHYSELFAKSVD